MEESELTETAGGGAAEAGAKKAVILAAGSGTRLRAGRRAAPKPLVKILGVSLLERQLQCLSRLTGLREVIVVLGSEGAAVRERIEHSGPWPFDVRTVENADWARGNGTSLYSVKDWVGEEDFFVLMADHMFEPATLENFAARARGRGGPALSVSNGSSSTLDVDDATKVRIDDQGLIREIGKDLSEFTAMDMGLFHLDGRIFPALERAFREGEHSLTAGVRRLIAEAPLQAVPSADVWFDIDTRDDFRHAERHLLGKISSKTDGLVAKHFNRRLSIPLSKRLAGWGVHPTLITFVAFTTSLLSGALFALGLPLAAGLTAQLSSVVDGMDGEIARMRGLTTRFGAFLDSLLDRLGDGAILLGLGLWAMSDAPGPGTLGLTALALIVSPMSMEVKDRYFAVYGRKYLPEVQDRWTRFLLANHDGRMLLICLGGIFTLPRVTLALLVGLGFLQAAYRVWRVARLERNRSLKTD